ncbi:MAG: translocation/assembly module TamB domain-containing protein [Desulfatibacillum sp.]|nr:translocation/assembly module TamB domain-containing protein [Desulfatibacillum sp.]
MKRLFKIFLWGIFIALAVGFVIIPLALRTDFAQERLAQVARNATKDLPVTISFSRIMPDVLSRVKISGLEISSGGKILLEADTLTVGPLLPGILGKERSLGRVRLENPRISLVRNADGSWNAASWFPSGDSGDAGEKTEFTGFPVTIPRIVLEKGLVNLKILGEDESSLIDTSLQVDLAGSLDSTLATLNSCTILEPGQGPFGPTQVSAEGTFDVQHPANSQALLQANTASLARWQALAPELPALEKLKTTVRAKGPFDKPNLDFAVSFAPEQSVEGTVQLDFSASELVVQGEATVKDIEILSFYKELPGNVNAAIKARITGAWPNMDLAASADVSASQVLSYSINGCRISLDFKREGHADLTVAGIVNQANLDLHAQGMAKGLYDETASLALDVKGAFQNVNPRKMAFDSRAPSGDLNFSLAGRVDKKGGESLLQSKISLTADFQPSRVEQVEIASATIAAIVSRQGVEVKNARISGPGGDLAFSGVTDYSAKGRIKANAKISNLSELTGLFLKEPVKGSADVKLTAQGDLTDPIIQGRVKARLPDLESLTGQFLKARVKGSADVDLTAQGNWANPEIDGKAKAVLPDLTRLTGAYLKDPVLGSANVDVIARGPALKPVIQAEIAARDIQYLEYGFAKADFSAKGNLEKMTASVRGKIHGVQFAGQGADDLSLDVALNKETVDFSLSSTGGIVDSLDTKGSLSHYLKPEKTLQVDSLEMVYQGRQVKTQNPVVLKITPTAVTIPGMALACEGQVLVIQGLYGFDGALDAKAGVEELDLAALSRALSLPMPLNGTGQAALTVKGTLAKPVADLEINAQDVKIDKNLPGVSLIASASYRNGLATMQAELKPETGGNLKATARLPVELGVPLKENFLPESGLDASIKGQGLSLAFVPQWVSGLDALDGTLDVDGAATGNPKSPELQGTASLISNNMVLQAWKDPIRNVKATIAWTPVLITIKELSARTQTEGELQGSGAIALEDLKPTKLDITLQTRKFDLSYWSMFTARADSDLRIVGQWPLVDLTGSVTVGKGEFRLDRFMATRRQQVSVEKDIHIVGEEVVEEKSVIEPFGMDLDIVIAGPMWVRGEGAQIEVGGNLQVSKRRNTQVVACKGYLATKRGVYEFRGKSFNVDKGRVDFIGNYPPDPVLEIVASHKTAGVIIYLEIGGTPSSMTITLSADPAMDQTDIASLLLFGKKSSDLSSGESKSLESQGTAILAAKALNEFKQIVGADVPVDMISVRSNGLGTGQDLLVGKYLSPKLFITYKRGISSQGSNEVQLEYQLTPKISVESQIGESESGVDLFWNYDY